MIGIDAKLKRLDGGVYDIQIGFNGDVETEDSLVSTPSEQMVPGRSSCC